MIMPMTTITTTMPATIITNLVTTGTTTTTQRTAAFRDRHLQRRRCKIDGHDTGDVGGREVGSGHERHLVEPGVEVCMKIRHATLAAFDQRGNLLVLVRTR